ncbi:MAG: hypothetical protein WAX67_06760 [Rugosibacter sp.]
MEKKYAVVQLDADVRYPRIVSRHENLSEAEAEAQELEKEDGCAYIGNPDPRLAPVVIAELVEGHPDAKTLRLYMIARLWHRPNQINTPGGLVNGTHDELRRDMLEAGRVWVSRHDAERGVDYFDEIVVRA